jgi:TRAP-type uncharacterized transport system substrate-binding protein
VSDGPGRGGAASNVTWLLSSSSAWSYSLSATQKMMDVTFSKQWIHFFRSLRWPPTSNMLSARRQQPARWGTGGTGGTYWMLSWPMVNRVS